MLVTLMDCPELKDIVPTFTREVPLEQFIGKEPGKDAVVVELQDVLGRVTVDLVVHVEVHHLAVHRFAPVAGPRTAA